MTRGIAAVVLACVTLAGPNTPEKNYTVDVCVYGGTSAGVAAAVAAARQGRTVALIEPTEFVGGMSASGIGLVDRGNIATIGGISREFLERAGAHYGKDVAWRIEPSVASRVFEQLLAEEPQIIVVRRARLESAQKESTRIRSIELSNGAMVEADVFVDATYEGDLMAAVGVEYTVGREPSSAYGESLAGIRTESSKHQFDLPVSPFVKKDNPASGLLPGISPEPYGAVGEGDASVPAYTYRLCLTKSPSRKAFSKPVDYDPRRYELLARYVVARRAAGTPTSLRDIVQLDSLPNSKFDLNSNGPLSTDFIGASREYAGADVGRREQIEASHRSYLQGLFVFLQTDPRLPQGLRAQAKRFGLAADEFTTTSNWPPLLYVREARRMLGSYVITQADCESLKPTPDTIGLASYMIDSHNCRRLAVGGRVTNEGDIQHKLSGPFRIPYRAMLPNTSECSNLLVPVCLSASHVAYSSVRMEPVFMILGHSAGSAAAIASERDLPVQRIPVAELRWNLRREGQVLETP